MTFNDTIGGVFLFYGAHNNSFKLDDHIFEVIEDPDDGYRSSLGAVEVVTDQSQFLFFREPLAAVTVKTIDEDNGDTGYLLVDVDDHVWLQFGTNYSDDYYPTFYFNYKPKDILPTLQPQKQTPSNTIDTFDRLFDSRDYD